MLALAVILSLITAIAALTFQIIKTVSTGRKPLHAPPNGSARAGMIYAFGKGMMPWEKESAMKHLPTYFGGVLYHLGIAAALTSLALSLLKIAPISTVTMLLTAFLFCGLVAGLGLLIKRVSWRKMRAISEVDDFVSNLLVNIFIASAIATAFEPKAVTALYVTAIVVFLYAPVGKIRHCAYFFYSRVLLGETFGRRGVLPQRTREAN